MKKGIADMDRAREMQRLYETQGWTMERIGRKYKVTRERVRQILLKLGATTRNNPARRESKFDRLEKLVPAIKSRRLGKVAAAKKARIGMGTMDAFLSQRHPELMHLPHVRKGQEKHRERNDGIAADYKAGMPVADIASKYGMKTPSAIPTMYLVLRRRGVPLRQEHKRRKDAKPRKRPPTLLARQAAVVKDYVEGRGTAGQIARRHGYKYTASIYEVLHRANVKLRNPHKKHEKTGKYVGLHRDQKLRGVKKVPLGEQLRTAKRVSYDGHIYHKHATIALMKMHATAHGMTLDQLVTVLNA